MKPIPVSLLTVIAAAGCYTVISHPAVDTAELSDSNAETDLRSCSDCHVDAHRWTPYRYGYGWGWWRYGYGLYPAARYGYDPFYDYYCGDPWWWAPPPGPSDPPDRGPMRDGLGDSPSVPRTTGGGSSETANPASPPLRPAMPVFEPEPPESDRTPSDRRSARRRKTRSAEPHRPEVQDRPADPPPSAPDAAPRDWEGDSPAPSRPRRSSERPEAR